MKLWTARLLILLSLATAALPARADRASDQINEVFLVLFQSLDLSDNGLVSPRESDGMIRLTFSAMDANRDDRVTLDEFNQFSMGFLYMAQVRDKMGQFNAAKAKIFRRWDSTEKGYLTFQTYRAGILHELTDAAHEGNADDRKLSLADIKNVAFLKEMADSLQ